MVLLGVRRLPEISILEIVSRGRLLDLKIMNSVLLALRGGFVLLRCNGIGPFLVREIQDLTKKATGKRYFEIRR